MCELVFSMRARWARVLWAGMLGALLLIWAPPRAQAFEIEERARFGPQNSPAELRILSTADIAFFAPVIDAYLRKTPDLAVDYVVASSTEVMTAIQQERAAFDLVISSAMDLQTKLANDGLARTHSPDLAVDLPDWAVWNDMVFAFTQEPAALVVSRRAFEGLTIPRNRAELITVLRQNPDRFRGRLGTYDIRSSGLGYLFATQDTRASETYWRLTEVMGGLGARLYCCSSEMIAGVQRGELAMAYNVLGSYAATETHDREVAVILPQDFTTMMLRSVLIPTTAAAPELAGQFVDHMLAISLQGEDGPLGEASLSHQTPESSLHRIPLGPGLLVFLDRLKRARFVAEWENAILQSVPERRR